MRLHLAVLEHQESSNLELSCARRVLRPGRRHHRSTGCNTMNKAIPCSSRNDQFDGPAQLWQRYTMASSYPDHIGRAKCEADYQIDFRLSTTESERRPSAEPSHTFHEEHVFKRQYIRSPLRDISWKMPASRKVRQMQLRKVWLICCRLGIHVHNTCGVSIRSTWFNFMEHKYTVPLLPTPRNVPTFSSWFTDCHSQCSSGHTN